MWPFYRVSTAQPMQPHLTGADLGYILPDGTTLFSGLHFSFPAVRTGLVGPNGAGKSTLLDLLAGRRKPSHGSITRAGRVAYLPQHVAFDEAATVADALGCRAELDALARIEQGHGIPADFDTVEQAWDLPERIERVLARLGIAYLTPQQPVAHLSGGELMRVRFAGLLLQEPDFLLLDEPTNHLDRSARAFVYDLVASWQKGLVVVSHDRALLMHVDRIAELDATGLRFYGGNFAFYQEQRQIEKEAAVRDLQQATLHLKSTVQSAREAAERQARREAAGFRHGRRTGVSLMAAGILKRRAENTAGTLKERHERRVAQAEQAVQAAREQLAPDHQITVDLAPPDVPAQKRMAAFVDVNYQYPGMPAPLWPEPLSFALHGPERVSVEGPNGSGKTTLLELLCGKKAPSAGTVYTGTTRIGVLDQHVALLDDEATLLDNLKQSAPSRPEHELRILLGRFLFPGEAVFKRAGVLSGGERIRAGLACLLAADQAPELLILDEPTNNLDLPSLEAVASALRAYRGTLVAVSHDATFLDEIGVTRTITLPMRDPQATG